MSQPGAGPVKGSGGPHLRVAQVWRGEVMAEVFMLGVEEDEVVTVGTTPGCTFTIGDIGLPPSLALLRRTSRGWLLTLGQGMGGEVGLGGRQQKVTELLDGGGAIDRVEGQAGSFRAVPVSSGDWGVVHLDGAAGNHVIFFRFDTAPQPLVEPSWLQRLAKGLSWAPAPYSFSSALHAYLLILGWFLVDANPVNFPVVDQGDALAGILVKRPEKPPEPNPEQKMPQAGLPDSEEKAPPASSEGEEGKSGGEGDKPRMRVEDPGDTAPPDPTVAKVNQRGLLAHSGKLKKVGSAMQSDRLGLAMSKLKGKNEGGAGYGKGKGTGVGDGEGTGTLTKSSGKGSGGGGTAHADVVTEGKIDSGGTRPPKGVAGGSPKETQVKVAMGEPEGDFGGLTKEQVLKVVRARASMFQACFEKELQRLPKLSGTITVTWHINPDGTVKSSKLKGSTMGNAAVESCIVRRVKDLKFPVSPDGAPTIVNFPFVFAPRK